MKIRTTVILFGIFAVALLTFGAYQWLGVQTGEEKKHAERYAFPSLNPLTSTRDVATAPGKGMQPAKAEDFSRLVIDRYKNETGKTEKLEFVRDAGAQAKWQLVSPKKVRTDDAAVSSLIAGVINLEKQKSRDIGRDPAQYGLDKPDTVITLTKGGQDYTLSLSKADAASKEPVYATSSESQGRPMLLTKSKVEKIFDPLAAFRDKTLIGSAFDIVDVRLAGTSRTPLEISKEKDWTFKEPALGDAEAAAADELGRNLASIRVERNEDFIAEGPLDEAKLAQYGVGEEKAPYLARVTRKTTDPQAKPIEEKLIVGNADPASIEQVKKQRLAAMAVESAFVSPFAAALVYADREKQKIEPLYYYARLAGAQEVVRISAKNLAYFQKNADELRSKSLAKLDNSKVDAVNLTHGGEALRLRRLNLQGAAEWELFEQGKANVKAQPQIVQNLLDALAKIEIKEAKAFLDDDAKIKAWFGADTIDLGLDKPQAELTVWQEGLARDKEGKPEGAPEPKLKDNGNQKPTVKFSIGKKDPKRQVVYVRREVPNLKPAVLAVPDPFVFGNANLGAPQAMAQPPDGRQSLSLTDLTSGGYLAFREHTLPSYRADQVTGVEVKRGKTTYVLERQEKQDEKSGPTAEWKLKQPVEAPAAPAFPDLLLHSVIGTSADKLVADQVSEKDLSDKYGLVAPLLQVTVKTKAEPAKPAEAGSKEPPMPTPGSTYIYRVGKKLPDASPYPNHYYARLETKPGTGTPPPANQFVFAVPLSYLQSLDVELRDTTIFPTETSKPASLTLAWHGETADKKLLTTKMDLVLAQDKWEIKSLTENSADAKAKWAKFDQNKVNAFLSYGPHPAFAGPRLNPLVVDRFLQHSGPVDPKYRLDPANAAAPPKLVAEVKYSDGKTRTLILGETFKPTDDTFPALSGSYYYLSTPALPGVVAIVNELDWRDVAAGPAYFQEVPANAPQ
jgi:hypothetical protein